MMQTPKLLALLLALAGCGAVVPATATRVAALNPLTANPADVAVALDLPPSLRIPPGGAALTLGASGRRGGPDLSETVILSEVEVPGGTLIFTIPGDGAARLRSLQTRIAEGRAAGTVGRGSLSIEISGACRTGPLPADPTVSIAIRLAPDGPFNPLVRNGPLSEVFDAETLATLPPCG